MIVHSVGMTAGVESKVTVDAIVVKAINELAPALAQHKNNVLIENEELNRKFSRFAYWEKAARWWLIPILIYKLYALAIANGAGLEVSWYRNWKVDEIGGKITLTPKQ